MENNEEQAPEGADRTSGAPDDDIPADRRPLGYWLRTVDGLITRAFGEAFAEEGVSRRDWMLLNALAGAVDIAALADKLERRGKRLREFEDRGWIIETRSGWELTDAGRGAQERLAGIVRGLRERVAGAVSREDFATMTASLEAIARELGWDETERMPRGRGRGFRPGFGRGRGRGAGREFTPGFGFGWQGSGPGAWGFGPGFAHRLGFDAWGHHGHHGHHGHRGHQRHERRGSESKGERRAERAYERGFAAGFDAAKRGERPQPAASDSTV